MIPSNQTWQWITMDDWKNLHRGFSSQPRLTTGGYYMVWVFFLAQPGGDPIADFSTHSQARIIQKKHGPNHCHVLSPFC
jgi:hypothetical protein